MDANVPKPRRVRERHEVRRIPERASYDRESVHAVLDAGWLAHVAFAADAQPFVIPMLYARDGERILLHGSIASRLMKSLASGIECCLCVTHVDGLVLARSHFHHSANYRSVVVFGTAKPILDPMRKSEALMRFVEAMIPGRGADARVADAQELAATSVLELEIHAASVKSRSGGPKDHPDDLASNVWAGVLPIAHEYAAARPAEDLAKDVDFPAYLSGKRPPWAQD